MATKLNNIVENKKLKEMLDIVNISDEELEKLDYKAKQKYYKTKNKLVKVIHKSTDENGKGITYRNKKREGKSE